MKVEISKIRVGGRFRSDLGDIDGLAASIKKYGLLHPVVVTQDEEDALKLIAGARRLCACRSLGWQFIEATLLSLDPDDYRSAEREENINRKPFTPTEIYEVSREILAAEEAEAKKRQATKKAGGVYTSGAPGQSRKSKDIAAAAVGTSRHRLTQIEKVMQAAEAEPEKYREIVNKMNETGNVAEAFRELKRHQREERIAELSGKARAAKTVLHNNKLYFGDNFKAVSDDSVDLIVTDPPYNLSTSRLIQFDTGRKPMSNNFGDWDRIAPARFIELLFQWSAEFYRVLRPGGSLYVFAGEAYISFFRKALISAGFRFKNTLVWSRPNPKPKPDKTSYVAACDFIMFAVMGHKYTFHYTAHNEMLSLITMPPAGGTERSKWGHPTQKPVDLITKLIEASSEPGDTVLDPFAGSGTTGEACINTGRRFILVEEDLKSIEMIEARTGVKREYTRKVPTVY